MTLTMLLLTTPLLLAALLAGVRREQREARPPARHGRARHAARPRAGQAARGRAELRARVEPRPVRCR